MSEPNPYASPVEVKETIVVDSVPRSLGRSFLTWSLVCAVSAAPSFFFGLTFGRDVFRVSGMIAGVLIYVVLYVYMDYRLRPKISHKTTLRRSMKIGYGARVAVSILYPVAIMIDLPCGLLATAVAQVVPFFELSMQSGAAGEVGGAVAFFANLFTTVVQGALLHVVLFGFMGIVYGIQVATGVSARDAEMQVVAFTENAPPRTQD